MVVRLVPESLLCYKGGSLKDAAKSALISGAIGGVTAGFSGPASGSGSFMKNVKFAAGNPLQAGAFQTDALFGTQGGIGGLSYDNPYGFGMSGSNVGQAAQAGKETFERLIMRL